MILSLSIVVSPVKTLSRKSTKPKKRLSWRIEQEHWKRGLLELVGVDEAGRGPLAGPVVAAAVVFSRECCGSFPKKLRGINDSKQLDESEREHYYTQIKLHADAVGVGVVAPQEIDEINILQATMRAMTMAVEQVSEQLAAMDRQPELLLVDGNYFRTRLPYEYRTVVDGDAKSPMIAAASVIAKVTRDRIMCEFDGVYPAYNFARHKGYSTPEHRALIAAHGLSPIHRLSFRTVALQQGPPLYTELAPEDLLV